MTITVTASGISLDGPLVAGEVVAVSVSGVTFAEDAKPTLCLLGRFPDALLSSVELAEDAQTPGTWTGELDTATKQTAVFFATARADECRDAVLELVAARQSVARLMVAFRNSALCPSPFHAPDASPVYIPVPGPPGQGGDPYDQNPAMDGVASAGVSDKYARGDHVHPTDSSRAAQADVAAIQDVIPSTATTSNKLATAADIPAAPPSASTATPQMDGTGAAGTATTYARGDHVHPSDTSKLNSDGLANTNGYLSAAGLATRSILDFGTASITAPTNSGAALTDSDISDSTSALGAALDAKADSSSLATVASTGDYGDLLNKPTIPAAQVNADWNAASGVAQILNKPTIPDVSGKADSAAIAPAFSSSSTYAVGDYATHEGLLYKCSTAVTTAGAWDASDWTATTCAENFGGGGGGGGSKPYDAEVEYVELDYASYFDTGIAADTIISAYGLFRTPTAGQRFYFGARTSTSSGNLSFAFISGYGARWSYGTNGGVLITATQSTAWHNAGFEGTVAFYNGVNQTYSQSGTPTSINAWLGTTNNNGSPVSGSTNAPLRIRSFTVETSGGIARDFIAVRKNGVGCLYDRVSETFFYNAGSGTVTIGPDIDQSAYATKAEAEAAANLLPYASTTTLDPATAVYRATATLSGTTATMPTVTITDIPTAAAYFAFELEVAVDATATAIDDTAWSAWTWQDGGELPTTDYAGKTLYIACRLDCTARTIKANCYEVA